MKNPTFRITLREDQTDLIVWLAKRISYLAEPGESKLTTPDIIGRKITRKRCNELIHDMIHANPEAGRMLDMPKES